MNLRKENCYIITGGPGVGKTTLINELARIKFKIISENAREIIKREILKVNLNLIFRVIKFHSPC